MKTISMCRNKPKQHSKFLNEGVICKNMHKIQLRHPAYIHIQYSWIILKILGHSISGRVVLRPTMTFWSVILYLSVAFICVLSTDRNFIIYERKFLYWQTIHSHYKPSKDSLLNPCTGDLGNNFFSFLQFIFPHSTKKIYQGCPQLKATGQHRAGC